MGRTIWRWTKRVLAALALLLVVLAIAGAVYQAIAEERDRAAYPPPGHMVDVDGFKMHLLCAGSGTPTVVLESGLGTTSPTWARVQGEVAAHTRVCSYDRAGIGWSEPSARPRDALHIAEELHALLAKANITGPYVLVGHSSGGLYVRTFQRLYLVEVEGMVLLDPTPEDFADTNDQTRQDRSTTVLLYTVAPILAPLGVARVAGICDLPPDFPQPQAAQIRVHCMATAPWAVQREELRFIPDPLPGKTAPLRLPLVVLTSGQNAQKIPAWGVLHGKIAALSSNSLHIVVPGAAHSSFLVDAKTAHLSAMMILKVVQAAVTGKSLR